MASWRRAPVLVVAGWQWRALGLTRPLRALCLGLVILLLAGPQIRRQGDGLDVWLRGPQTGSEQFDPLCLVGPNGAGKSQLLQICHIIEH